MKTLHISIEHDLVAAAERRLHDAGALPQVFVQRPKLTMARRWKIVTSNLDISASGIEVPRRMSRKSARDREGDIQVHNCVRSGAPRGVR